MSPSKRIVIIGGVAGGATAAARLRRLDEQARIVVIERGEHISFANCGLPYFIGGEIAEQSALVLQTPDSFRSRFNVDVRVRHEAKAIDPVAKTVTVRDLASGQTYQEPYDALILAPGAEPVRPGLPGADLPQVFTLRTIPDTVAISQYIAHHAPRRAVVVGGGYIGMEMTENLVRAGLAVTVVELTDQVIAPLDYDMACEVHRHLVDHGVDLRLKTGLRAIAQGTDGLVVELDGGQVAADLVVLAIGVRPENALALSTGLRVNARGAIVVDAQMRTSQPDIYAVGDAVEVTDFVTGAPGLIPLAGPANKQGRIAADTIGGLDAAYTGTQGSAVLRVFDLTVAATGINEKTAQRLGLDYDKSFTYPSSHAGYYPGAHPMSIKTIFEVGTGRILGAQLVGADGVDKRCDVLAVAIRAGMTAHDLTQLELCYAPPYSSAKDPVNLAGYTIENLLGGLVKNVHWHDVDTLPRDGSVTLLDTRTPAEYQRGHIDGFVNIALDDLRARLGELDRAKPIYVTCQVGLRGYVAARILSQHGFDVFNLSGGYRLYEVTHPR
jgi:NADPH-dependent 2,4-dienoyl-CoA reductase/sulfur reductase-like enzyme/rhodanese-related sulfurtransferase